MLELALQRKYYHCISPVNDDPRVAVCRSEVAERKGLLVAKGYKRVTPKYPFQEGIVGSPYEMSHRDRAKECFFDQVRRSQFPYLPARLESVFLFRTVADAELAGERWWTRNPVVLEAQIIRYTRIGIFDARFLDRPKDQWDQAAVSYWLGEQAADPLHEVLVEGEVQLFGWERYYEYINAETFRDRFSAKLAMDDVRDTVESDSH